MSIKVNSSAALSVAAGSSSTAQHIQGNSITLTTSDNSYDVYGPTGVVEVGATSTTRTSIPIPGGDVHQLLHTYSSSSTYSNPKLFILTEEFVVNWDGVNAVVFDPDALPRGELMMLLENKTGVEQLIYFGSKLLKLAPGMNAFRYDGELTAGGGFPAVSPLDFTGSMLTGSDGTKYVAAQLENSGLDSGEVRWRASPVSPPTPPTSTADQIEIISPATSTKGATIAIRHSGGGTTITTLPVTPPQTPSNTTGSGGVISDPTQPKPTQTPSNTVTTNNIYNTTNNTTVKGSTFFGDTTTNTTTTSGESVNTGGPSISTSGADSSGILDADWGDIEAMPAGAITFGTTAKSAAQNLDGKIKAFNPFSELAGSGGDLTIVNFEMPNGHALPVALPLDSPGIPVFRLCCLFALYWRYCLYAMKILRV